MIWLPHFPGSLSVLLIPAHFTSQDRGSRSRKRGRKSHKHRHTPRTFLSDRLHRLSASLLSDAAHGRDRLGCDEKGKRGGQKGLFETERRISSCRPAGVRSQECHVGLRRDRARS